LLTVIVEEKFVAVLPSMVMVLPDPVKNVLVIMMTDWLLDGGTVRDQEDAACQLPPIKPFQLFVVSAARAGAQARRQLPIQTNVANPRPNGNLFVFIANALRGIRNKRMPPHFPPAIQTNTGLEVEEI
jgi:hypothetical protein